MNDPERHTIDKRLAAALLLFAGLLLPQLAAEEVDSPGDTDATVQTVSAQGGTQAGDAMLLARALANAAEEAGSAVVTIHVTRALSRTDTEQGAAGAGISEQMGRETMASPYFRPLDFNGSGVVWSKSGEILTSRWNIGQAIDEISVSLADGRVFHAAVLGYDEVHDLALLELVGFDGELPTLRRHASPVRPGEFAIAVGRDLASPDPTASTGLISAVERRPGEDFIGAIQHTCRVNLGNVGGPLVDVKGDLIGLTVGVNSNPALNSSGLNSGVGFAVSSDTLYDVVEQLRRGESRRRPKPLGRPGPETPFVGVGLEDDISGVGVRVNRVVEESAAAAGGVQVDDVILKFDGVEVFQVPKLQRLIRAHGIGDEVVLLVRRDEEETELTITLGKRKD